MTATTVHHEIELESLPQKTSVHSSLHHLPLTNPKDQPSTSTTRGATPEASIEAPSVQNAAAISTEPDPRTKEYASKLRIQFPALCFCLFLCGWNDATIGPLLPKIREVYQIGFTKASLVFIVACIGFCIGATVNVYATDRVGFGKLLVIGCALQAVAYSIQASGPPLPLFLIGFVISGMGVSIQVSQATGYVASLQDHTRMGFFEAAYGIGAFAAPLVATQFANRTRWSFHYLVSLGIALLCSALTAWVFKFKHQDECLTQIGRDPGEKNSNGQSSMRQLMSLKAVHLLAAFIFIYVGTEVTIGGWTVTYIIENRDGGSNAGYISSGFFGGMTVGRVLLLWVNRKVGERRVIFIYCALAIGFELIVWLVPSLIGGAVAVSIVGVLLGPCFPIAMSHAAKVLPRWLLTASIGWIAGLGQAGTAVLPFLTGAFAGKFGIGSLQPFLVAMMGTMAALWAIVPNHSARLD